MRVLSDEVWARIEPLLPPLHGRMGQPMRDHRLSVEGAIWRCRTGSPWRDVPPGFGSWQTACKRDARFAADGIWDEVLTVLLTEADAVGELDGQVSVVFTITRAHQHGTNNALEVVSHADRGVGGSPEVHESAHGAC